MRPVRRVDAARTPARFSILLLLPVVLHPEVVEQLPFLGVLGGPPPRECELGAILRTRSSFHLAHHGCLLWLLRFWHLAHPGCLRCFVWGGTCWGVLPSLGWWSLEGQTGYARWQQATARRRQKFWLSWAALLPRKRKRLFPSLPRKRLLSLRGGASQAGPSTSCEVRHPTAETLRDSLPLRLGGDFRGVNSKALPGAGSRPLQTLPGGTWSPGASSSLSVTPPGLTEGAHVHIAIEVAQLKEWAAAATCKANEFNQKCHNEID